MGRRKVKEEMLNEKSVTGMAVVIGAGTMGGGIAAQLANAGWQVRLLDVAGPDPQDRKTRNQAAMMGLERVQKSRPPLLYLPEFAARIQVGNTEDNLDWLRDADWIVEAVAEKLEIKQAVLAQVEAQLGPETVISTNTSGLSLQEMTAGRSTAFRQRFLGTHFFNPPRYLKLLELIRLPETDPEVAAGFSRFAERVLGRRVVLARDTPGFISNRVGTWHLLDSIHTALAQGLMVEEVDYLTGPLIGRPRSATFRLADLIGFDVIADIARSQYERLPDDPFRERLRLPEVLARLMAEGRKGEKSGAGFYRREGQQILALDLQTLEYRPQQPVQNEAVEALLRLPLPARFVEIRREHATTWGIYLNAILDSLEAYVSHVTPEIADDPQDIDRVMQWGFNWEIGPSEIGALWEEPTAGEAPSVGSARASRAIVLPRRDEAETAEYISLVQRKEAGHTVQETAEGSLIDIGEGVACLEFHTKMNTFNPALAAFVQATRERAEREFVALVVGNQGRHFSAGYDMNLFLQAAAQEDWNGIDRMLRELQEAFLGLKYARIPVVVAPYGYTLGGGCECALQCPAAQAAAELVMGLPETSVGVIPAGGGTKEMLARAMDGLPADADPYPEIERVFELIAFPRNSSSADEARKMGLLRATDGISLNPDRVLFEAKERGLGMANAGYHPRVQNSIRVLGEETLARLRMQIHWRYRAGQITDHDRLLADKVAYVLSGGNLPYAQEVSEAYLLQLEREVFVALMHEPKSVARMRHVLETGKPLIN